MLACGISHDRYDLPRDLFFTLSYCSHLRGHGLKMRHRSLHHACLKAAFSVRNVERHTFRYLQWRPSRIDWVRAGRPYLVWMTLNSHLPFEHDSAPFAHS